MLLDCGDAVWVMIGIAGLVLFRSLSFWKRCGVFLLKLRTERFEYLRLWPENDMFEQGFLHLYLVPVRC